MISEERLNKLEHEAKNCSMTSAVYEYCPPEFLELVTEIRALRKIVNSIDSVALSCEDFDHQKKDQHKWDEPCPPLERYRKALKAWEEDVDE